MYIIYSPLQHFPPPIRLKHIKHPFYKGMQIPSDVISRAKGVDINGEPVDKDLGSVAKWMRALMTNNSRQIVNQRGGATLPHFCLQLQTRMKNAQSMLSCGSMKPLAIIRTPWEKTKFCEKMQSQLRLYWDPHSHTVCDIEFYNFTFAPIQQLLKSAYEELRQGLMCCVDAQGVEIKPWPATVTSKLWGGQEWDLFLEFTKSKSYGMRLNQGFVTKLEALSRQLPVEKDLFEFS